MRAIKRTGTKPEEALRRALHRLGYRYRKDHRIDLSGGVRVRPDIVFTARKVAVFVDGCFWHVCPEHGRQPTVNEWYWAPKLRRTMERDRAADIALTAAGWRVVRLWEHMPLDEATAAVCDALGFRPGTPGMPELSGTPEAAEAGEPAAEAGEPAAEAGEPAAEAGEPAAEAGEPTAEAARSLPAQQALAEIPRQASHHEVAPATREGG